jgi:hypothetical protein
MASSARRDASGDAQAIHARLERGTLRRGWPISSLILWLELRDCRSLFSRLRGLRSLSDASGEVGWRVGAQALRLMPLGIRMMQYVSRERRAGREPFMDPLNPIRARDDMGVPLGGLGGGSITRGSRRRRLSGTRVRWW